MGQIIILNYTENNDICLLGSFLLLHTVYWVIWEVTNEATESLCKVPLSFRSYNTAIRLKPVHCSTVHSTYSLLAVGASLYVCFYVCIFAISSSKITVCRNLTVNGLCLRCTYRLLCLSVNWSAFDRCHGSSHMCSMPWTDESRHGWLFIGHGQDTDSAQSGLS